jgi:hypothetical protein
MTNLSPQAQAVLDAAAKAQFGSCYTQFESIAAAVLRAAADQVTPTGKDREDAPKAHSQFFFSGMKYAAIELRAIAAELESGND